MSHLESLLSTPRHAFRGELWRSLGRFEWDLGYPPFTAERARVLEIARQWKCP